MDADAVGPTREGADCWGVEVLAGPKLNPGAAFPIPNPEMLEAGAAPLPDEAKRLVKAGAAEGWGATEEVVLLEWERSGGRRCCWSGSRLTWVEEKN